MPIVKHNEYFEAFVADELPSSVAGKVFVITGTTSGSGFIAARTVMRKGGEVVALNRKSARVTDATTRLESEVAAGGNTRGKLVNIECNLQEFASVRGAIVKIKERYTQVYCLANNAGIGSDNGGEVTVDGYNKQMQTNHFSHFLLTAELFPLLQKSASNGDIPRIVHMTSGAKNMAGKKGFDETLSKKMDPNTSLGGSEMSRYAQTKLFNVLFTHSLEQKLQNTNILAVSANPGAMGKDMTNEFSWIPRQLFYLFIKLMGQSSEDGTMGLLLGMMSSNIKSGVLYGPAEEGMAGPAVANTPKPYDTDAESMEMLWKASEEAVGVKFDI
jgi:NAD(P)-dependent dehydrogenase (short-subunit alcohol dehydrogenase family)